MDGTQPPGQGEQALLSALESVLLAAGGPIDVGDLARALDVPRGRIPALLDLLRHRLTGGIRLQLQDGQAQLATAPENAHAVQRFLGAARPPALSRPALEALTVIAYRQPVTRPEIEAQRGVNSDRAVQTLLARGLIEERGVRTGPGRPMQYGTTFAFLEYFGLASLEDLPPLEERREEQLDARGIGLRSALPDDNADEGRHGGSGRTQATATPEKA